MSQKSENTHWSELREKGSYWGMAFSLLCYRLFGRTALLILLYPIVGYFFLTKKPLRLQSRKFLTRVYEYSRQGGEVDKYFKKSPGYFDTYCHILQFGQSIADRISALTGTIRRDNLVFEQRQKLLELAESGTGAVILTSHLGSTEMMRALLEHVPNVKMNVLVYSDHVAQFNKLTKNLGDQNSIELVQISDLNAGTAITLNDKIERGEFVVISSDRTSPNADGRETWSNFLGYKAPFPQGAFILTGLLDCPVYLLFCLKENNRYMVYFEKFSDTLSMPRKVRKEKLQECIDAYAQRLEFYACRAPLQWFNFFDFWGEGRKDRS